MTAVVPGRSRVALVTGGSRGIGAAIARRLAATGLHVVVNYATGGEEAAELVSVVEASGGTASAAQADVSDPAAVASMFDRVDAVHGGVDVLVNNAGIQLLGEIGGVSDDDFDALTRTNLKGTFNTMREAARRMTAGGRIVNLSSGTTIVLQPRYAVYAATKAAVIAMTAVMAREMRGRGITVNAVSPGPVATELYLKNKSPEQLEHAARQSPLERLGQPGDIAGVVAFLAGKDGGWINGQTVVANGAFV